MSKDQTAGRIAVITGASSGIGAATARALAADGYGVALLARRLGRIEDLARRSATDRSRSRPTSPAVIPCWRQPIACRTSSAGPNVLVNNAGVMLLGPFSSEQRADYRTMIEANLLGAITATEVFLDQLKAG